MSKALNLRWLEVFQLIAKSGSVQKTATETGLSISTVSSHLRSLESALGVNLVDHTRRPMELTPAGVVFGRHVYEGLTALKRGEAEIRSGTWQHATELRLALLDDFDNEVGPELFQILSIALPRCSFRHYTRPSHEIIEKLQSQKLDAGVASRPSKLLPGLIEYPLMRDPFIVVLPAGYSGEAEDIWKPEAQLPFLRYSREHTIGKQIEAQLNRLKITLPNRFEMECNQSIISLVSEGSGWTISTAASYHRAQRFHDKVTVKPFPGKSFARIVSLFTTNVCPANTSQLIHKALQKSLHQNFSDPISTRFPWLAEEFRTLPAEEN
ncbi:LysR family transcriptional regulator [Ruegeria arenilitoris]|uniref:LysR substrate-binding domain-containing protein n=1 Tax=Ruegeria arenilitoris TaxID=1173585 RepID=UPI001480BBFE|nr:LysR family transcriptional regulator [Ruegeria arenilitoris]